MQLMQQVNWKKCLNKYTVVGHTTFTNKWFCKRRKRGEIASKEISWYKENGVQERCPNHPFCLVNVKELTKQNQRRFFIKLNAHKANSSHDASESNAKKL